MIVANKVRGRRDEEAIKRYCAERELEIMAMLPFDEAVLEAEQSGTPIIDADPRSSYVQVFERLLDRLHAALNAVS